MSCCYWVMTDGSLNPPNGFLVKRVYDEPSPEDGYRVLVDGMWPRGLAKADARIDEWAKVVTPSTELRRWFHEDRDGRADEFGERFRDELSGVDAQMLLRRLREQAKRHPPVTLLTAVKEPERSHIPVLLDELRG